MHTLYEFPAGKLDPGETPFSTIERELEEETGYIAEHWEEITTIVTSPGFCNEKITIFKATGLKLSPNPRREEDEFIQVMAVSPDEIREMIRTKKLIDAKTICALALIQPEIFSVPG
jgi:ADP-ribose pyrophosphatase